MKTWRNEVSRVCFGAACIAASELLPHPPMRWPITLAFAIAFCVASAYFRTA